MDSTLGIFCHFPLLPDSITNTDSKRILITIKLFRGAMEVVSLLNYSSGILNTCYAQICRQPAKIAEPIRRMVAPSSTAIS
jgi:hypothetical protein